MEQNTLDLVAKLLANENINVVRAPVTTAAFDIVGRTLILPQWKEMTPAIDQMLVAHEVAHALFTTTEYNEALETRLKFKRAKSFLNILEDVRIEKLMKRRYPGLRKVFHAGYKELNDMDFFEVRGRDLSTAHFMDRINLYFKVGFGIVVFSPEEKAFVNRAENLDTIEQTVQLAQDIHDFLKEQEAKALALAAAAQQAREDEEVEDTSEDTEGECEQGDGQIPEADDGDTDHSFKDLVGSSSDSDDGESRESDQPGKETSAESEGDSSAKQPTDEESTERTTNVDSTEGTTTKLNGQQNEIEVSIAGFEDQQDQDQQSDDGGDMPTTNTAFESRVSELADTNTVYRYWTIGEMDHDPIVSFKEVTAKINSAYQTPLSTTTIESIRAFKRDTQNNVDYLVKEFEMRKAATAYKRSQVSKSGSLDMKRVWSYKLNDDLFKRVTTVKQGKNHGMVFLLDWSGSMQSVIKDTIDQVTNLAMFCQRAGIAYEVFAFTDAYTSQNTQEYHLRVAGKPIDVNHDKIDVNNTRFSLLELFSNKMSQSDFNTMVNNLKSGRMERVFSLNGTPLNEALVFMYDYIGKFRKANNVEKVSFITLTDGQGGCLCGFDHIQYQRDRTRKTVRHYVRDLYTKESREITRYSPDQTNVLIQMIKSRYECAVLGFYVTQNNRRVLVDALRAHYNDIGQTAAWAAVETMKSDFRAKGYSSLKNTGRDELFVIPTTNTKVQYEQLEVDGAANARSIASKFGKYMSTKKTSRVLLDKFIGYVA